MKRGLQFFFGLIAVAIISVVFPQGTNGQQQPQPTKPSEPPKVEYKPKVAGYIEGWYRHDSSNLSNFTSATDNAKRVKNEVRIRRARIDVKGNISEEIGYRVNGAFDGPSPASKAPTVKLWDGYLTYDLYPLATLTVGQFKYHFTLEGLEGTPDRIPILRAESINDIANKLGTQGGSFRDIGVQISGSYKGEIGFKYGFAAINGSGINTGDNNDRKDYVGRIAISPIKSFTLGVSGYSGRGEDEVETFEMKETAYGVDGEFNLKDLGLGFRAEYVEARWENWDVATGKAKNGVVQKPSGWYVQGDYRLPFWKDFQLMGRYEDYDKNYNMPNSRLKTTTIGTTYYFTGKTRISANYLIRKADSSSVVTAQETDATGSKLGNLFLVQMIVTY